MTRHEHPTSDYWRLVCLRKLNDRWVAPSFSTTYNENLERLWAMAEYPSHQQREVKTYEALVTGYNLLIPSWLHSHTMSFRLRLPNQIDGLLCTARRITGLTSTKQVSYFLHLTVGPAIFENMVDPFQEFPCRGYLSNLPSLFSLYFEVETT